MKVASIVAMGKNRVIGLDNQMMWHIPSEFNHYRGLLGDHYFVIGRKNYDGSHHKLNMEKALVLTRNCDYECESSIFYSPQEAIEFARDRGETELFVLGGEEIYRTFMPLIDTLYLSIVDIDQPGDAYFPPHENYSWHKKRHFKVPKNSNEETPIDWEFFELEKN